jgi:DNA-binding YbaB/EbfC family protein
VFKGLGNLANLGSLLKQAQQMGSKLAQVNEELKARRVSGTAGGGLVTVETNGVGEVLTCRVDPATFASGDRELIEDLLPAAINDALAKSKQMHAEAMKALTAGLDLPGVDEALAQLSGGGNEPPSS